MKPISSNIRLRSCLNRLSSTPDHALHGVNNMAAVSNGDTTTGNHSLDFYYDLDLFEHHHYHHYNQPKDWLFYCINILSPIAMFGGVFGNGLALFVLLKCRLWLRHEGYVYLAASFCGNVGIQLFGTSSFWLSYVHAWSRYHPTKSSNFMCKFWTSMEHIFFATGWMSVALLFDVCLRDDPVDQQHSRRCRCPRFAAMYCTLLTSKIVVIVISSVLSVCCVPFLVLIEWHPSGECYPSYLGGFETRLRVGWIVISVLPFVLFLCIVLRMAICTKTGGNDLGFAPNENRSDSDRQMQVTAVILPSIALPWQAIIALVRHGLLPYAWDSMSEFIELSFILSACLQPVLCFLILQALRDGFLLQLRTNRCCYSSHRLFPSLNRDDGTVQLIVIQAEPPSASET